MERVVMLALLCAKGHKQTAAKVAGQLYADRQQYSAVRTLTSHVAHIRDGLRAVAGDDRLLVSDRMIGGGVTYGLDLAAAHAPRVGKNRPASEDPAASPATHDPPRP